MAEQSEEKTSQGSEHGGVSTVLKAAAAAAAASAAAYAAKKAFSGDGGSNGAGRENGGSGQSGGSKSTALTAMAAGGWDAARDVLLPAAEDAAAAVGSFVAENAPEIVRDRIVPRFIESFNDARGG